MNYLWVGEGRPPLPVYGSPRKKTLSGLSYSGRSSSVNTTGKTREHVCLKEHTHGIHGRNTSFDTTPDPRVTIVCGRDGRKLTKTFLKSLCKIVLIDLDE